MAEEAASAIANLLKKQTDPEEASTVTVITRGPADGTCVKSSSEYALEAGNGILDPEPSVINISEALATGSSIPGPQSSGSDEEGTTIRSGMKISIDAAIDDFPPLPASSKPEKPAQYGRIDSDSPSANSSKMDWKKLFSNTPSNEPEDVQTSPVVDYWQETDDEGNVELDMGIVPEAF